MTTDIPVRQRRGISRMCQASLRETIAVLAESEYNQSGKIATYDRLMGENFCGTVGLSLKFERHVGTGHQTGSRLAGDIPTSGHSPTARASALSCCWGTNCHPGVDRPPPESAGCLPLSGAPKRRMRTEQDTKLRISIWKDLRGAQAFCCSDRCGSRPDWWCRSCG